MNMHVAHALVLLCVGRVDAKVSGDNPSFMMVSGITSPAEMCLTVANGNVEIEGVDVVLESCAAAVAAGDGREIWQHLPNGQISNALGGKCIGTDGDSVNLKACDGGSTWELQGNGQLKLGRSGEYCLSQRGSTAGDEDVALRGATSASSSADTTAHGANMAVDGSSSTFWASALDPDGPVSITIDLGGARKLSVAQVLWEFPAKAFTISVSTDGLKWSEVYATDSNVLTSTNVALGSISASKVRVVMHEAAEAFQGHSVYGIKGLSLHAARLQTVVEDCASAAKSNDARDKYFETHVNEFSPCSSKALRSELPSLEAARASVASVVAELTGVLPKLSSCHRAAGLMSSGGATQVLHQLKESAARHERFGNKGSLTVQSVDSQNGIHMDAAVALIKEARRVILATRDALS